MTKQMRKKRKALRSGMRIGRGYQEDRLHPIEYGHIFVSGEEGHGQS
jgi:hypothetical protein